MEFREEGKKSYSFNLNKKKVFKHTNGLPQDWWVNVKKNFSIDVWIYSTPSVSLSIHLHPLKIKLAFETNWFYRFLDNLWGTYDSLTLGSLYLKLLIKNYMSLTDANFTNEKPEKF